jgi:S1-C subfamily serine protease
MKLYKSIIILVICLVDYCNCFTNNVKMNLKINNNNNNNNYNNLRRNLLLTTVGFSLTKSEKVNAFNVNKKSILLKQIENEQKELFNEVISSVCYISTEYTSMGEKFNLNKEDLPKGVGSGFIWDDKGHIITNFHVINKVDNALVTITKNDKSTTTYKAKLTGIDPDNDLAILKIDAPKKDLKIINYNKDTNIDVGQFTFAVGNPFGQDHTLTTGVISGINRELSAPTGRKIYNVIQTDAAINPGNSGGPLFNSDGEILGINTASLGLGVSSGIGFTIPIKTALKSINDIIRTGYVEKAILGISYMERNPTESESIKTGIPIIEKGLLVLEVPENSPAFESGIKGIVKNKETNKIEKIGDIIIGINDENIDNPINLYKILNKYKPKDKIKLKYLRNNIKYTVDLILGNYKGTTFTKLENERGVDFDNDSRKIDIPLKNLEPKIEPKLN